MRKGRPPAASEAQREEVLRLSAEGWSQRKIAEAVFGDARFHGRVERILCSAKMPRRDPGERQLDTKQLATDGELASEDKTQTIRELVNRYEQELLRSGEVPSLTDIERLLRINRQLDAIETVERTNALTRTAASRGS